VIENAAIGVVRLSIVLDFGDASNLPTYRPQKEHDFRRRLVTPGLLICHTHFRVFGGMAEKFEQGAWMCELSRTSPKTGGGIASSVKATRDCQWSGNWSPAASRRFEKVWWQTVLPLLRLNLAMFVARRRIKNALRGGQNLEINFRDGQTYVFSRSCDAPGIDDKRRLTLISCFDTVYQKVAALAWRTRWSVLRRIAFSQSKLSGIFQTG